MLNAFFKCIFNCFCCVEEEDELACDNLHNQKYNINDTTYHTIDLSGNLTDKLNDF